MGIKLKKTLESVLKKSFREIVLENLPLGTGRYESALILQDVYDRKKTKKDPDITIIHSTLWYTVKRAIKSGELCKIEGDPSSPPLFYFNYKNKKYTSNNKKTISKNITTRIYFECSLCGNHWIETKQINPVGILCLRSKSCSICQSNGINSFGKIKAKFKHNNIIAIKSICNIKNKLKESFVDKNNNPCDSPFLKKNKIAIKCK